VDGDLHVGHRAQVGGRPQRTADEALDLLGAAALLPARGLALDTLGRRAGQHRVLRGDPSLSRTLEPGWHTRFERRRAEDARTTELDEHRSGGHLGVVARERDGAEVVRVASGSACRHAEPLRRSGRVQTWVLRCGAASETSWPNASEASSTEASGSMVGHKWVIINR